MNILVAGDSFKGSLSSKEFTYTTARILEENGFCAVALPLSDGGEGALEVLTEILGGEIAEIAVLDSILRPATAKIGISGSTYIIESAQAVGLPQLGDNKDIMSSSSYGVGQMMAYALDRGAERIYLTIGGTACNDGGAGLLAALKAKFLNSEEKEFIPQAKNLSEITDIDVRMIHPRLKECDITVLSDVTNPLLGDRGATYVYGPQKGGDQETLPIIEGNIEHFAERLTNATGIDHCKSPGAGAGGGIGFAAMYLNKPKFMNGADEILRLSGFDEHLEWADMVITGEGRFDEQSFMGKICGRIIDSARGKKIGIICGISTLEGDAAQHGLDFVCQIGKGKPDPIKNAHKYLVDEVNVLVQDLKNQS